MQVASFRTVLASIVLGVLLSYAFPARVSVRVFHRSGAEYVYDDGLGNWHRLECKNNHARDVATALSAREPRLCRVRAYHCLAEQVGVYAPLASLTCRRDHVAFNVSDSSPVITRFDRYARAVTLPQTS